jgi:Na+/proline symporter
LIGLLLAVIMSAAMSSTASGLNALVSTTAIDIYKRNLKSRETDVDYLNATKFFSTCFESSRFCFVCIVLI